MTPRAPSAPAGLNAVAASATQVNLSWTASTDNVGVTGYEITRNGTTLTTTSGTGTTYTDPTAAPNTFYTYSVRATDAAGNFSQPLDPATVTTPTGGGDTTAPSKPAGLNAVAASATQVNLSWTASTDNVGVTGYEITPQRHHADHDEWHVNHVHRPQGDAAHRLHLFGARDRRRGQPLAAVELGDGDDAIRGQHVHVHADG